MLNMDFTQRVVVNTLTQDWQASPMPGVWRKPLAREEAERGHATSIVRYQANSHFSAHDHPAGEEILVLEGVFSDESGDYPAGTYFRNPEGYRHAPFSEEGCVLLVKLHQFQKQDDHKVCVDTSTANWGPVNGQSSLMSLHSFDNEFVGLVRLTAGECLKLDVRPGGEEVYVVQGEFSDNSGYYPAGSWIRNPHMRTDYPPVREDTLLWVKLGHLPGIG